MICTLLSHTLTLGRYCRTQSLDELVLQAVLWCKVVRTSSPSSSAMTWSEQHKHAQAWCWFTSTDHAHMCLYGKVQTIALSSEFSNVLCSHIFLKLTRFLDTVMLLCHLSHCLLKRSSQRTRRSPTRHSFAS